MHSVEASIVVNAPVADCYRHWRQFERFPDFMSRVVSVQQVDPIEQLSPEQYCLSRSENPQQDYEGVMTAEVVREVAAHGNFVWRWEIQGPLGQRFAWVAGVVMDRPNQAISWASTAQQEVSTTGTVNFLRLPGSPLHPDKTLISVTLSFSPPLGGLGELLADMVGYGDNLLYEALGEFKTHLEQRTQAPAQAQAARSADRIPDPPAPPIQPTDAQTVAVVGEGLSIPVETKAPYPARDKRRNE